MKKKACMRARARLYWFFDPCALLYKTYCTEHFRLWKYLFLLGKPLALVYIHCHRSPHRHHIQDYTPRYSLGIHKKPNLHFLRKSNGDYTIFCYKDHWNLKHKRGFKHGGTIPPLFNICFVFCMVGCKF